jgi:HEPN domain-containing protein
MPAREKVTAVVSEWITKAENDLKAAALSLRAGKECPTDTVCFHAQQAAEKYLKALLTDHGVSFPRTHNIGDLVEMLPPAFRVSLSREEQDGLTDYATGARYPGWGEIPLSEARRAVAVARRVRKHVRSLVPRRALLPSKRR